MPFPVLGSNSAVAAGYEIDNSLRFNNDDSAYLTKTPSSTGNRKTWTFSCWFKLSNVGTDFFSIFTTKYVNGENTDIIINSNKIEVYSVGTGGYDFQYATSQLFRDVSAWYHLVVAVDTTQGTDSNRVKIYINGSQVTSFSTTNHPNQNFDTFQNLSGEPTYIGASDVNVLSPNITRFFDGYLSEIYMIDGTQHAASDFGEYNDNGVWIPKEYEGTYGTNGFKLEFKNSGNLGDDTSGNGNNFTATNLTATDQTTDTPTNNFCTANPLQRGFPPTYLITLSEGNTQAKETSSNWIPYDSTIGVQNGKWYWECKNISGSPAAGFMFGIQAQEGEDITGLFTTDNRYPGYYSGRIGFSYHASGTYYYNGASTTTGSVSYTNGDIIMLALDMDNGFLYAGKNGTWNNSGDPTSGASGTGNVYNGFSSKTITPCNALNGSSVLAGLNFGNPSFTISSGNADANGYGNFEYAVPSGYYSLCTKNLAEYG